MLHILYDIYELLVVLFWLGGGIFLILRALFSLTKWPKKHQVRRALLIGIIVGLAEVVRYIFSPVSSMRESITITGYLSFVGPSLAFTVLAITLLLVPLALKVRENKIFYPLLGGLYVLLGVLNLELWIWALIPVAIAILVKQYVELFQKPIILKKLSIIFALIGVFFFINIIVPGGVTMFIMRRMKAEFFIILLGMAGLWSWVAISSWKKK